MTQAEPQTDAEARGWIAEHLRAADPFRTIAEATETHRLGHGCEAFASADGALLGAMVAATASRRILEVGTALGYSAAWLATGNPDATVETVEVDDGHAALARINLHTAGLADRVKVHIGLFEDVAKSLDGRYDLVFYDASIPGPRDLRAFRMLLRERGLLITSNLFLGRYVPGSPQLEEGAHYREALLDREQWLTSFAEFKAISVKV